MVFAARGGISVLGTVENLCSALSLTAIHQQKDRSLVDRLAWIHSFFGSNLNDTRRFFRNALAILVLFLRMENDKVCTLIINGDTKVQPTPLDIQKKIEQASSVYMQKKDAKKLVEALEELLLFMVNGNSYPRLLMTIIRFVITCDDHRVKKLLSLYWEICDKVKDNGELKEEMVLVCNALRNDLISANEYIRGRTLRLLCRMRYFKIMEPLIESILKNLSHRHAYVRRNAVMCVYSVVKTFGTEVIPQASVEIEQLLLVEGDLSTKRIAFIMLLNCDIDRAINYALSVEEQVTSLGDVFQLAILELVRKAAKARPGHKASLLRLVFYLATGSSPAVTFECAEILSQYGTSPSAAQVAAQSYVHLLTSQPDNNVKLIVLEKLERMRSNENERFVIEALVMDILRGLSCPAFGVRRAVITLVANAMTSRNVSDIVALLKKEIAKTASPEATGSEGNSEYRRLLIQTLQQAARKFPEELAEIVTAAMVDLLRDSLNDLNTSYDVMAFLREAMITYPYLRPMLVARISVLLPELNRSRVIRTALWLIGEFSESHTEHIQGILDCLAPLPVTVFTGGKSADLDFDKDTSDSAAGMASTKEESKSKITTKTVVLADGTYASKAIVVNEPIKAGGSSCPLRTIVRSGDVLLCNVVGITLAKLFARTRNNVPTSLRNQILFAITCLVRIVKHAVPQGEQSTGRLMHALRVVAESDNKKLHELALKEWNSDTCRAGLLEVVKSDALMREKDFGKRKTEVAVSAPIVFRQIKEKMDSNASFGANSISPEDLMEWVPGAVVHTAFAGKDKENVFTERLTKATAMTGLADAVYIEGFLRLHSFDLILELTIVNRTSEILQNILVELCTNGDLKVVDKPQAVTLAPGESARTFGTIKVSSTESALIFGYATFDRKSSLGTKEWLVLNEVRADVLDYMQPNCVVKESSFKAMWQEFEWENKIAVNTHLSDPELCVKLVERHTNLHVVGSPERIASMMRQSQFAAVNMYAKSIFGEDALANISLERGPGGELSGSIRIRARTQGIAISLGDKVTHVQREHKLRGA